jgi:hypothetical protein
MRAAAAEWNAIVLLLAAAASGCGAQLPPLLSQHWLGDSASTLCIHYLELLHTPVTRSKRVC